MMATYDRDRATRLVPLLRSITREIRERTHAVEHLEARLMSHRNSGWPGEPQVRAELACHRRELRRAREELARLGCALDESHPLRVLIPGRDGKLRSGFEWTGNGEVDVAKADSAV
jgi:hypothetical protein